MLLDSVPVEELMIIRGARRAYEGVKSSAPDQVSIFGLRPSGRTTAA